MKFRKAFTIIEVLVVIGIIAILTAIIFPSINEIRKKNRDTERVSDISSIQLGLALYYSHYKQYPSVNAFYSKSLSPKYIPSDSLMSPDGNNTDYKYIPLNKAIDGDKCTYYHLGVELELPNAQIDSDDDFSSVEGAVSNGYKWCEIDGDVAEGINPEEVGKYVYHIRPN